MPEHFTRNTVEASFWCAKCGGPTPHRVDSGRRGPCLLCLEALDASQKADRERMFLFEERAAIIEYDGNRSRARAEQLAHEQMAEAADKQNAAEILLFGESA
jgi:hypothetical protein